MTHKNIFFITLLFAFFGIQSINAQSGNRTIIFQGYAVGGSMENFWQGTVTPFTTLNLDPTVTYGLLYTTSDDGSDDSYQDAGLNFQWRPDGENYIYFHYTPEFFEEGDKIRYTLEYDGFEILQTDNAIYMRSGWFDIENTTHVSFKIYQ